jgi:hypothetical protein
MDIETIKTLLPNEYTWHKVSTVNVNPWCPASTGNLKPGCSAYYNTTFSDVENPRGELIGVPLHNLCLVVIIPRCNEAQVVADRTLEHLQVHVTNYRIYNELKYDYSQWRREAREIGMPLAHTEDEYTWFKNPYAIVDITNDRITRASKQHKPNLYEYAVGFDVHNYSDSTVQYDCYIAYYKDTPDENEL